MWGHNILINEYKLLHTVSLANLCVSLAYVVFMADANIFLGSVIFQPEYTFLPILMWEIYVALN